MAATSSPIEAARELAPLAAELAAEGERERQLPTELSRLISEAGLYRLCVPASLDGGEASPSQLVGAVEALAVGDAAAGWCVAVCATSGMLAAYVDEETAHEVFADPASVTGGVFAPTGRAAANDDLLTVTGRWRFTSNVANCDWLMGGCIVYDDDQPRMGANGRLDVQLVLFPAADAEVIDTWSVSGLRATGSHDTAVDGLELQAARSASLISGEPRERRPLYGFPAFGLLAASIAGVCLGTARGALDDLAELAGVKTPTLSTRKLAERPATQERMARAEAQLRAARALLYETVAEAERAAASSGEIPVELRARLRLAATHGVEASVTAVDIAYNLGGGSAIYETSPLQRRFRDVHTATQHMLVAPATWELSGRSLLGLELDASQL